MAPSSNSNIEARISLQRSRFQLIQHATEFDNDDDIFPTTRQFINTRLEMLEQNWSKFQEGHEELCHSEVEVLNHQYMKSRVYERCQEFYIQARAKLLTQRDEVEALLPTSGSSSTDACAPIAVSRRLSALPKIALPRFSGNFQDWRSFHDLFTSLILNNSELSDVERMHYLKTSLSGDAARFVTNLPVSGDNFAIAWETLVSRYDNKRFLISAHLDRLTSLKPLKNKSAQDLSSFLATVSESLGALRSLECLVDCWDPLLLHMLIKLLDSESREAWEVKLGSSTSYPSFSQFEDFLIGRSRHSSYIKYCQ